MLFRPTGSQGPQGPYGLARSARCFCARRCCRDRWSTTQTGDTMSGVARDVAAGAAKRRRDRRYRSFWRHELMAVRMATLTACHHSAQKKPAATRAATQTTVTYFVLDQRGSDSKISGRSHDVSVNRRAKVSPILECLMRRLRLH